ncbi:MAG: ActS/PrrB/RegB family redox-sensitive histidine kinase [Pseudomonadota bacterium]
MYSYFSNVPFLNLHHHSTKAVPSEYGCLRLRTIIRLRWIAVLGQSITLCIVYYGLAFNLPIALCFLIIAISISLNLFLTYSYLETLRLETMPAFLLLSYDLLQLSGLLFLTGGIENPFMILIVVPVIVSASTQPPKSTALLGGLAIACVTVLLFYAFPLPWYGQEKFYIPWLFKLGVWTALVSAIVFTGVYARRIALETLQMSNALRATEMVLAREQKLSALDGLAAAAAHELGTPLATISVIAKELEREINGNLEFSEDIQLLKGQAERCREILQRLADNDGETDAMYINISLTHFIQEVVDEYSVYDKSITITHGPNETQEEEVHKVEPKLMRNPGMRHGFGNILENAVDFAKADVQIIASWDKECVILQVIDDGPGVPSAVLKRLGEPYITSRESLVPSHDYHHGMGLGFFIAKTLLERSGATVEMSNRAAPLTGVVVQIRWPRRYIDIGV